MGACRPPPWVRSSVVRAAICDRDRWLAALTHTGHPVLTGALAGWHALSDYQLATGTIDRPGWHQQLHTVATALTRKDT